MKYLYCCCRESAHRERIKWCRCAGVLFTIDHSLKFCRFQICEARYPAGVARRAQSGTDGAEIVEQLEGPAWCADVVKNQSLCLRRSPLGVYRLDNVIWIWESTETESAARIKSVAASVGIEAPGCFAPVVRRSAAAVRACVAKEAAVYWADEGPVQTPRQVVHAGLLSQTGRAITGARQPCQGTATGDAVRRPLRGVVDDERLAIQTTHQRPPQSCGRQARGRSDAFDDILLGVISERNQLVVR
ncbi:hypothetical protein QUG93_10935 [Curtobacterium sp. RHCKG28]|uniref:Uncharacterized protein n=1 Tax=Curtobacterium caseinilyticum TaxID=3055137 RepID=A0ABT7TTK3_9MICO|nr:hypothetical protein [Curtobacterium caseinilyticum]MDM7892202.1 hypothetical protein [Curtobacterium caseinilyticum]